MSLSDSFTDSNGHGSANFLLQVENKIRKGDVGKQKDLQPQYSNTSDGQGSISRDSENEGWHHLPRSSSVISRRQALKMKKPPVVDSSNKVFHKQAEEIFQKGQEFSSASNMLQNIFPEEKAIPTSSVQTISQVLISDTCCALNDEKCSDEQRNLSHGSSDSQSSSYEERDLLNPGALQLEKGALTGLNKCLSSGE